MRNGPEQLTASHMLWGLKSLQQNTGLCLYKRLFDEADLMQAAKTFGKASSASQKELMAYVAPLSAQANRTESLIVTGLDTFRPTATIMG